MVEIKVNNIKLFEEFNVDMEDDGVLVNLKEVDDEVEYIFSDSQTSKVSRLYAELAPKRLREFFCNAYNIDDRVFIKLPNTAKQLENVEINPIKVINAS